MVQRENGLILEVVWIDRDSDVVRIVNVLCVISKFIYVKFVFSTMVCILDGSDVVQS